MFYHFFYFFRYSSLFRRKLINISFFRKKINYFKFFFNNIFKYLRTNTFKNLNISKEKSTFLTQNPLQQLYTKKNNMQFNQCNLQYGLLFEYKNAFRVRQGVFFFPKYGKKQTFFRINPKKNLIIKKLKTFL